MLSFVPASMSFSSFKDHQTPCPPINIGRLDFAIKSKSGSRSRGSGQALGAGRSDTFEWTFLAARVFIERRKHYVDGNAEMDRPGIAARRNLPGAIDEFTNSFAIGHAFGVLGQRGRDFDVVDFLETTRALSLQRA